MPSGKTGDVSFSNPQLVELFEELTNKLQAGEPVDLDDYIQRYPDDAEVLRQFFPAIEVLIGLGQSMSSPSRTTVRNISEQVAVSSLLGDFRILRERGRGGMGVVYEAEQVSLARRVALKVLPFAAMLDQRQLSRFKIEAQAAAQLHHANIVPVFAVGCERGVHYYAMQFIDGKSLAQLIEELRREAGLDVNWRPFDPGSVASPPAPAPATTRHEPRAAATTQRVLSRDRLVVLVDQVRQVAEALDYAHQQGVIHRDIKPANLMLDGHGKVWITDFGLARLDAGATLTVSGDVVGTLRYMSPEQALGKSTGVDHRTDIYALGATLYELLALEPAFGAADRQLLMRQISQDEPRALQQFDRDLPAELQTIVQKAMSKENNARYATAQEFADDLRRFLEHKPIHAQPPTLIDRGRKWCRRHEPVVWATGISTVLLLVIAVIALAVNNILVTRERNQRDAALRDRDRAIESAQANLTKAEAEQVRSQNHFHVTVNAIHDMLNRLARHPQLMEPQLSPLRRDLLESAAKSFEKLSRQIASDSRTRFEIAIACSQLDKIYMLLEQPEAADAMSRRAEELLDALAHESSVVLGVSSVQAQLHFTVGYRLMKVDGRRNDSERHLRLAIESGTHAVVDNPDNLELQNLLANAHHSLGYLLWSDRPAEAEPLYRRAIELHQRLLIKSAEKMELQIALANDWNSLGILLRLNRRAAEAEEVHRRAISLIEPLKPDPLWGDPRGQLARAYGHLALALIQQGQLDKADETQARGLGIQEQFHKDNPANPGVWQELAAMHRNAGQNHERRGRPMDAEQHYGRSLELQREMLLEFPNFSGVRPLLVDTLISLGTFLDSQGRTAEAAATYEQLLETDPEGDVSSNAVAWHFATCPNPQFRDPHRAVELAKRAVERKPLQANYWNTLGVAHYRAGQWNEAIAALTKSMDLFVGKQEASNTIWLAMSHFQLGHQDKARKQFDQAVQWIEKNPSHSAKLRRFREEAAELLGIEIPR